MEHPKQASFLIFLNSDISKKFRISLNESATLSSLYQKCKQKFKLDPFSHPSLYDSHGEILTEDDLDYVSHNEALFCTLGEEFTQNILKALYKKIKTLGHGGFGTVKLYKSKLTKTLVAIKFVKIKSLIKSEFVSRAYKEIQVLRDLNHPNIVKLLDVIKTRENLCFVMEYCEGGEIKKYIQEKKGLSDEETSALCLQICEAIRFCHTASVIHRDLKPENIMFRDKMNTQVVIVDFGIAGICSPGKIGDASSAGSLLYLAPEVITGSNLTSRPELDIWSLGCIIFFLLTAEKPFAGSSRQEIIKNIVGCRVQPLKRKHDKWRPLIQGCLCLDPGMRWSIYEIIEYLHKIKNDEVFEEVKTSVSKSSSLRCVKTPEPFTKLPIIMRNRNTTKPKKKTFMYK